MDKFFLIICLSLSFQLWSKTDGKRDYSFSTLKKGISTLANDKHQNKIDLSLDEIIQVLWNQAFDLNASLTHGQVYQLVEFLRVKDQRTSILKTRHIMRLLIIEKKTGILGSFIKTDFSSLKWDRSDILTWLSLEKIYPDSLKEVAPPKGDFFKAVTREFVKSTEKETWSDQQIDRLIRHVPVLGSRFSKYKRGVSVYMFCRHNRMHPCLFVMKDRNGKWVKGDRLQLWSQPKLAMSRRGLPSHQVNGETPQGIYTIDSVMPEANRPLVFGQYRRLILNFIDHSVGEKDTLFFIPKELHQMNWWRQATVARDVGRALLRIHGTGRINTDPASFWYPFYPTSGCIASRENTYDGVSFRDQRLLLDTMMRAMGLRTLYSNEEKIRGILYVVNIDSREDAVKEDDILPLL